jgi:pyruvate dehydrogenase E1 component beta subunit
VTTIIEALRAGIAEAMDADPGVFVVGEDVRFGGTFGLTQGLVERFGERRVLDAPISEAGFVGLAMGAGLNGMRAVVDFQYGDFLLPAANMVIQEVTKLPYMAGGGFGIPMVIHAPTGASARGAQHSNSIEQLFFGVPGLRLGVPSTPFDAKGMMTTSIRADVPTLICAHKHLYGAAGRYVESGYGAIGDVPSEDYEIPVGEAVIRRPGSHVTVVGCLLTSHRALEAAEGLADEGIDAEVIDLRWLAPLDLDAVAESVGRTGALVVVEEGPGLGGWAASVVAGVVERAPGVRAIRVSGPDESLPAAPHLEAAHVPTAAWISDAVRSLLKAPTG